MIKNVSIFFFLIHQHYCTLYHNVQIKSLSELLQKNPNDFAEKVSLNLMLC